MSLRGASGKFSLSNFGRKISEPISPSRTNNNGYNGSSTYGNGNGNGYDDDDSPTREGHGGGGGGGAGAGFDHFGKKLKGSLAHNSLLPALGNKDVRALQDLITLEKGVMQSAERLATESQKAASALPPYGIQEGPDLQDILTQSSTLLGQLTTALNVFASHQGSMRAAYKRIREREEQLAQMRSTRRSTGQKADTAERKLAKMGPENKSLPSQTELLERLRQEMRTLDQDIGTEETKIGDFKRQVVKEALSLKFGGLEELGEKMCIIGELGKLLLEEVPLEETPVGYGRAPYTGYEKTESAVNEATRCVSESSNAAPKPPGLPQPPFADALRAPSLPRGESSLAAAEEFGNYPGNIASPDDKGKGRQFTLDNTNPYGGVDNSYIPNAGLNNAYSDFGGVRGDGQSHVMFQGPSDDHASPRIPAPSAGLLDAPRLPEVDTQPEGDIEHSYEYEQQKQMDAEASAADEAWKKLEQEEAAWKEQEATQHDSVVVGAGESLPNPHPSTPPQTEGNLKSPWEPLNVKRGATPDPITLRDGPSGLPNAPPTLHLGTPIDTDTAQAQAQAPTSAPTQDTITSPTSIVVPPRPAMFTPGPSEFFTPSEGVNDREILGNFPQPGGKISAAAFRKGVKPLPRTSLGGGSEDENTSLDSHKRRLPVPPGPSASGAGGIPTAGLQGPSGIALPASPMLGNDSPYSDETVLPAHTQTETHEGRENSPPPQYHGEDSLR